MQQHMRLPKAKLARIDKREKQPEKRAPSPVVSPGTECPRMRSPPCRRIACETLAPCAAKEGENESIHSMMLKDSNTKWAEAHTSNANYQGTSPVEIAQILRREDAVTVHVAHLEPVPQGGLRRLVFCSGQSQAHIHTHTNICCTLFMAHTRTTHAHTHTQTHEHSRHNTRAQTYFLSE